MIFTRHPNKGDDNLIGNN